MPQSNGTNLYPFDGTVKVALTDSFGNADLVRCTVANIPSAVAGYAIGCILKATDTGGIYTNTGTATSATFTLLEDAGGSFTLPTAATDATTTTTTSFALTQNAVTTGAGLTQALNGLTTGFGHSITHTTSVIANGGSLLNLSSTGVDTGTSTGNLLNLSSTASTAGTQILLTASALTTGVAVSIVTAALTTGSGISITANALTSGAGITITSSSADTTARGLVNLTSSSGSAVATAAIRSAIAKQTTHFQRMWTDSVSGVTLWFGDGTTANGALTGVAGDVLFNGGTNKPEYCTGTTNWTALV